MQDLMGHKWALVPFQTWKKHGKNHQPGIIGNWVKGRKSLPAIMPAIMTQQPAHGGFLQVESDEIGSNSGDLPESMDAVYAKH